MQLIYNNLGIFVLLVSSIIDVSISETRVVCYYTNWSVYRPGTAKFNPQNINPYLCTHLIYAFGGFTKDNQLKPFDKYQDIEQGGYAKFSGLKTYNKELKTMLAIGGWNEGSTRFSPLVASADRRGQLVKNTIKFLRQNKFDGLDLDWEYPAFRDGGKAKDRENYAKLVQELREEFDREHQKTGRPRLLLTMAVPAGLEYIDKGYDVPKLNKYLDWFNLLSYDYHSAYEPSVNHHAPLYPIEEENEYSFDNDLNINATINYYLKSGADRDKLVLGIPTYGRSYTLFNADSNEIGAPADGPGEQGDATREKGYLAYYEICQSLKEEESEWTVVQPNPDALGPYAYKDNQWVGYDDEEIVRRKSEFVVEQKLGGIMFWSIDNDDFRGLCGGKPYPLIEAAKEAYLDGLENGVRKKTKFDANKRKQQTTTTRKPESKKSGKTTTPAPPTTPSSGSDFKCEEEGFFAHPSDCTKYFWCLEAPGLGVVAHHFSCPSGLVFNKAADSCDYARNVHCTNKTPKTTTTTEAPSTTSTTTEKVTYNKIISVYKNPTRATTPRTTTPSQFEIDSADLEQEDPKVIKELIELIKKAGGIEELEKQINIQEESSKSDSNLKSDSKATTPATIINKSLVDKIKNRASLFKSRPPLFNGASQPERSTETKTSTEKVLSDTSDEKQQTVPKKYNSINRFTRPEPQSAGIDKIPESDAVLIEKPQYTSIFRRKPVKPDVIIENDYNNESDKSSEQIDVKSSSEIESTKKYTSISRQRKPQPQEAEEINEDEDELDEKFQTTTYRTFAPTSKSTVNKYINLSRRRSTTPEPEEKTEYSFQSATSTQGVIRTTLPPRRRATTTDAKTTSEEKTTAKTVLEINTNHENQILSRNTFENTLSKNTATNIERETLISNKHIHDDDDEINHIALPTESVTENIPFPESVTTTQNLNTISPHINDNDKVIKSFNDIFDSITENSDIDITTVSNEYIVDNSNGISEKNNDNSKSFSTAPRPFTRSKISQTTPTSPPSTRNLISRRKNENNVETTRIARRRPTVSRTYTNEVTENESIPQTPRPTYSYRQGYRGTARFRPSTSRSGEYEEDGLAHNYQFQDDNRLRSLNVDRVKQRPPTKTTSSTTTTAERTTRRRPAITKTKPTTTTTLEAEPETTTESKVLEVKNRFNIGPDERPDRIRFELTAGGKINFGFNSVKSKEKSNTQSPTDGDSKLKVITGPLNKSPLVISGRELRKGHVEEIPIQTSPETVTVQNFSNKLDLSEIPLNKSDIESFVSDSALRTDNPIVEDTTIFTRKRPSKIGFKKRPEIEEEIQIENIESTTESRRGFSLLREQSRKTSNVQTENINEANDSAEDISTRRTLPKYATRARSTTTEKQSSQDEKFERKPLLRINNKNSQLETSRSSQLETSSPRSFQRRLTGRTRARLTSESDSKLETKVDTTSSRYLTKIKASDFKYRNRQSNDLEIEDNENSETQEAPEESTLREFRKANRKVFTDVTDDIEDSTLDSDVLDMLTEKPIHEDEESNEIDFTTVQNDEYENTETPLLETTSYPRKVLIRKKPKKIESLAARQTITEPSSDFIKSAEIETTSTSSYSEEDDDFETEIETAKNIQNVETTTAKTNRRVLVTRKRKIINDRVSNFKSDESDVKETVKSTTEQSTTPKITRKRILTIRTKTGVIKSPVEIGNYETTEAQTEAEAIQKSEIDDTDVIRKRIKVYRSRATTERAIEESSTHKPIVSRTRVFKRPVATLEEKTDAPTSTTDETETSERSRYTQRRKVVKLTRKPAGRTESESVQNVELENENSTVGTRKGGFRKILRTKTPKIIVNNPIEEDSVVIKADEENQQSDQIDEQPEQKDLEIENQEFSSEEPSSPILKYPTRPSGKLAVTIRKRPSFIQGSRQTTVHPASTRFTKEEVSNVLQGRTRKTTRRFRPGSTSPDGEIEQERKFTLGERNKKIFTKSYRKSFASSSTTNSPNITPHNIDIETETNEYDEVIDNTDNPQNINNNGILQTVRPRFPLSRFTTSTTSKPTTLHHVFAIDVVEGDKNKSKNADIPENQADEVIKKLQKLIEINRIVEVYSKEEKLKLLKNKKLKSIKEGELTLERPPAIDKFGEITREVIIKLSVKPNMTTSENVTTDKPNETRSPKNIMFSETVFGAAETSTISLEGLFDREKKELELKKEQESNNEKYKAIEKVPLLRPESNETNPYIISIANLDKVILSKISDSSNGKGEVTTEIPENDETTTLINDD